MSIIQAAVIAKSNPKHTLDSNVNWKCLSFDYKGNHYDIAFENNYYGVGIRQFMINGEFDTGVKSKYESVTVNFDCSNSLLGVREFENGSIAYEFLKKPLGLAYISPYTEHYDDFIIAQFLKEKEIIFDVWYY